MTTRLFDIPHPFARAACRRMRTPIVLLTLALCLSSTPSQAYDYASQDRWRAVGDDMQSPVDIDPHLAQGDEPGTEEESGRLQFHLRPVPVTVKDTGHALQGDAAPGNWAMLRGRRFALLQAHFHAPGEHALQGSVAPLEGHLVFRSSSGRLAVVAVRYVEGEANPAAALMLAAYRAGGSAPPLVLSLDALLPAQRGYYHYLGSLTTPPLSQNVEWYVLVQPVSMSAAQLEMFGRIHGGNNRRLQPLNGRPVLHFDIPS